MFEAPLHEIASPQEQLAVARCAAIVAAGAQGASVAQRRFIERLMASMMLLPEERDRVRKEFVSPSCLESAASEVQNRQARIFLLYQVTCVAFADNALDPGEQEALRALAHHFDFSPEVARSFVAWVKDTIDLSARGQELIVSL